MAYITTERVAEIRKELKVTFPGFKFSVVREHHSSVNIDILEAPVALTEKEHEQVNIYSVCRYDYAKGQKRDILKQIIGIANKDVTYHETGDYGTQPSFYLNIHIGRWDKPFKMVVSNEKGKPQIGIKLKALKVA